MSQIRRITKLQKRIVNAILNAGLDRYNYDGQDFIDDLCFRFNVVDADIIACIEYIQTKFYFVW